MKKLGSSHPRMLVPSMVGSQIYKHLLVQFRIGWVWTCRDSWILPFELYVIANLLYCCAYSFVYLIDISAILHCIRWHGNIDCSCVHKGYNVEVRTIHGKRWQFPVHDSSQMNAQNHWNVDTQYHVMRFSFSVSSRC